MTDGLDGTCPCGRLRYRIRSGPILVNCCHCRDCQRRTGLAFAINAMIEADRVEQVGEAWSAKDRTGDAPGDRAWRCAECGGLLYAEHPMFADRMVFVRAGTLDRGETMSPDAHYFVRSKHPWVAIPNGMPAFETVPETGAGVALAPDQNARLEAAMAQG